MLNNTENQKRSANDTTEEEILAIIDSLGECTEKSLKAHSSELQKLDAAILVFHLQNMVKKHLIGLIEKGGRRYCSVERYAQEQTVERYAQEQIVVKEAELNTTELQIKHTEKQSSDLKTDILTSKAMLDISRQKAEREDQLARGAEISLTATRNTVSEELSRLDTTISALKGEKSKIQIQEIQSQIAEIDAFYCSQLSTIEQKTKELIDILNQLKTEEAEARANANCAIFFLKKKKARIADEIADRISQKQSEIDACQREYLGLQKAKEQKLAPITRELSELQQKAGSLDAKIFILSQKKEATEIALAQAERSYADQIDAQKKAAQEFDAIKKRVSDNEKELARIAEQQTILEQKKQTLHNEIEQFKRDIEKGKERSAIEQSIESQTRIYEDENKHAERTDARSFDDAFTTSEVIIEDETKQKNDAVELDKNGEILSKLPIVLEKLDEEYPDKIVGDFRSDNQHWYRIMMQIVKLQGYESKEAFLNAYGYTLKNVLNTRSEEAKEHIFQRRLTTLFEHLDSAYPDKKICDLGSRHASWARIATDLAHELGFENKDAFLMASGYTIIPAAVGRSKKEVDYTTPEPNFASQKQTVSGDCGVVGRPAHDRTAIIDELKRRYPNGSEFTSADDLFAANPDLAPKKKALANRAKEYFGMPLGKYLTSIGLIGGIASHGTQIEERKERLFSGLSEAYPDKLITNLKREHHSWYTASESLARNEGFEKLEDFFSNYGFVYKEKDYEGILKAFVDELRSRLATADHIPSSVDKLTSVYSDMDFYQPKKAIKFIYGNSKTLDSYLQEIGVLCQPLEEDREMLNYIEILKERYKNGKKKPLGLSELASDNHDLPIIKISKFIREVIGEKKAEKYYIKKGILQGQPTDLQEFDYCSVQVASGGTYYYIVPRKLDLSIGDQVITSDNSFGEIKDIQTYLGIDAPQSVRSTSRILRKATEEEKFYGEAITENTQSNPTTPYGYSQNNSESVRRKILNMQEIEELIACLDSMLQ